MRPPAFKLKSFHAVYPLVFILGLAAFRPEASGVVKLYVHPGAIHLRDSFSLFIAAAGDYAVASASEKVPESFFMAANLDYGRVRFQGAFSWVLGTDSS